MNKIEIQNEQDLFVKKTIKQWILKHLFLIILVFLLFITLLFFYISYNKHIKIFKSLEKENHEYKEKLKYFENIKGEYELKINLLENNLVIKSNDFKQSISYYIEKIKNSNQNLFKEINLNMQFKEILLRQINMTYNEKGIVNINEIEANIDKGRKWERIFDKSNEVNIGFQLDPGYILRTMMTLASIMDSQKPNTKLRFHFAVVLGFNSENMLKIYSLREKIREDVEFIFYNAEKIEKDFKGMHPKGPGAVAKFLLPHLLPDDIEKIIIFDTGDVLVLRDLKEMYNWNISDYLYMGTPDPCIGNMAKINKKPFNVYINLGHFLLNVKKIKSLNMYEKYLNNKNVYNNIIADQDLLNDIAQEQIGYLPIKFGLFSPFLNDEESDNLNIKNQYEFYNMNEDKLKNTSSYIPKNSKDYFKLSYNPVVIHQWNGKWMKGSGLSIYRRLCQYYIRYAGIWNELCTRFPGYCQK